ncbi:24659_t:CDS:1 [Dentiscutata erythropus]|uniref:24659_t:CDS:1 n=1 Tax=Dentiscutata erythropus TaxID=1348616 RepID=A0A9N8ZY41_9GLOM|nr:24659_t:CDS:1 [Dentiscutata erythropus]
MSKKFLHLTILALICIIAGLVQTTPIKRHEPSNDPSLVYAHIDSSELAAVLSWHWGAAVPNKILMNLLVELVTIEDITVYDFKIYCDDKVAFDLTPAIIDGSTTRKELDTFTNENIAFAFFTETFTGVDKPAALIGYTLVICRDGKEIGRTTIS